MLVLHQCYKAGSHALAMPTKEQKDVRGWEPSLQITSRHIGKTKVASTYHISAYFLMTDVGSSMPVYSCIICRN